ncbi:hypothetical protein BC826DRAFT_965854 [Russula brevipes]|nr:hypothetical protein BC826DRAFT_965854 [Russula brevipes]
MQPRTQGRCGVLCAPCAALRNSIPAQPRADGTAHSQTHGCAYGFHEDGFTAGLHVLWIIYDRGSSMAMKHLKRLFLPLKKAIIDKRPFVSGTLKLPATKFSLFYKIAREGHAARHVNFTNATADELEQLAQTCQPATFGRNDKDVMDETYRKAGKMDPELFSTPLVYEYTDIVKIVRDCLLDGTDSLRKLKVEPYKLNVYEPKLPPRQRLILQAARRYPARPKDVLIARACLSNPARGHRGQEWSFDSAAELSTAPPCSIGYVAFFSDVEHEVAPVVSGHRITLTYNLHFDDDEPAPVTSPEPAPLVQAANERSICAAFEALLANPEFLPDGGVLGFGLQHVYQIKGKGDPSLGHVYGLLKGSDAALYRAAHSLGFEPVLYLYYKQDGDAGLIDRVLDFESCGELEAPIRFLLYHEGVAIRLNRKIVTPVNWVTPVTTFNSLSSAYVHYGNEASLGMAYGNLCLIVRIGKMGERMLYPTVAQLKQECREARERSPERFRYN